MFDIASSNVLTEKRIQNAVVEYARSKGWIARKFSSPGNSGEPDYIFFRNKVTIFIEFKKPGACPTRLQRKRLQAYHDEGFRAVSCDDVSYGKGIFDLEEKKK